jgi:hypothetical protein
MDYSVDLLKGRKKSKAALIIGFFAYLLAIIWIPIKLFERDSISWYDFGYPLIIVVNGLTLTLTGLGYSVDRLFGKAFIRINNQVINIKTGAFDKEQIIDWESNTKQVTSR